MQRLALGQAYNKNDGETVLFAWLYNGNFEHAHVQGRTGRQLRRAITAHELQKKVVVAPVADLPKSSN